MADAELRATYGLHRPMIARLVNESGRAQVPRFSGWKSWGLLIPWLPTVISRNRCAIWTWIAANRVGQLIGSLRSRTVML